MQNKIQLNLKITDLELSSEEIIYSLFKSYIIENEELNLIFNEIYSYSVDNLVVTGDLEITNDFMYDSSLLLKKTVFKVGKEIGKQLSNAEKLALYSISIPDNFLKFEINDELKNLNYFFLDSIANIAISKTLKFIYRTLKTNTISLNISNSYCPGNCGWHFNDLSDFIRICPKENSKITILDSNYLTPIKSNCGIFIFGKNVKYSEMDCLKCKSNLCKTDVKPTYFK